VAVPRLPHALLLVSIALVAASCQDGDAPVDGAAAAPDTALSDGSGGDDGVDPAGDGADPIGDAVEPAASGPGTEPPLQPDGMADPGMEMTEDDDGTEPEAGEGVAGSGASDQAPEPSVDDMGDSATPGAAGGDAGCDLSKTRTQPGDRAVVEGELCDDLVVCLTDGIMQGLVTGAEPSFDCSSGENPIGLCEPSETACIWRPGVLDASEAASVCDVTAVLPPGAELVCIVYL
jgi:hypothetical protein